MIAMLVISFFMEGVSENFSEANQCQYIVKDKFLTDTNIVSRYNSGVSKGKIDILFNDFLRSKAEQDKTNKILLVSGLHAVTWAGVYIALNKAWYKNYPKSKFHFFNDVREWNGMDKAGHIWTAYQLSKASAQSWAVAGRQAVLFGSISGLAFQTIIEIQDGFSSQWGFSWGDMTANTLGAMTFFLQGLNGRTQNVQIKFAYYPVKYSDNLTSRTNQLFGTSLAERILKDYNSQTYWISIHLKSIIRFQALPDWLSISGGYGSSGMLGAVSNEWTTDMINYDRTDIKRTKKWLLSLDADLSRIKVKSRLLKNVFHVFNSIKIPFPAVEYKSTGTLKLHGLHF